MSSLSFDKKWLTGNLVREKEGARKKEGVRKKECE